MSAFHEVQFPPSISYGATGGPTFNTSILTLASGYERRNINWEKTRAMYDVAHGLKTQVELNALLKFFYARNGRAYGFRYKDWADYQLPFDGDPIPTFMTTDGGITTSFQLRKAYGDAGNSFIRDIKKPVAGSVVVYADGFATSDVSIDVTTGIVTLGTMLRATTGAAISASCQFDVPVRFDIDQMKVSIDDYDNFTWGQIPLIEVRV